MATETELRRQKRCAPRNMACGRGPSPARVPRWPHRPPWAAPSAGLSRGEAVSTAQQEAEAAPPQPPARLVPHSWPLSCLATGLVPQRVALSQSSLTSCCGPLLSRWLTLSYGIMFGNSRVTEVARGGGGQAVCPGGCVSAQWGCRRYGAGSGTATALLPSVFPDRIGFGSGPRRPHFMIFLFIPPAASCEAGEGGPGAAAPQQEAGAHGGPGPDADPHDRTALPADVQQSECLLGLEPRPVLPGSRPRAGPPGSAGAHSPSPRSLGPAIARSARGGVVGRVEDLEPGRPEAPGLGGQQRRDSLGGGREVVLGLQGQLRYRVCTQEPGGKACRAPRKRILRELKGRGPSLKPPHSASSARSRR